MAGCALVICGAGVIARGLLAPAAPPAPQVVAVPVALDRVETRAATGALVVVPALGQADHAAASVATDTVDPLAIDLARLAARIARERQAETARRPAASGAVAANAVAAVPAAPRPAAALPGPRLTRPATLAALDLPDRVPGAPAAVPVAPVPDFLAAPPSSETAEEAPGIAIAALPDRARMAPPARPGRQAEPFAPLVEVVPLVEIVPSTALAASLVPLPRPGDLVTRRPAATAPVSAPAPETVVAIAPAPAPAPKAAPAPKVTEPALGPRVAASAACRPALARQMPNRKGRAPEGTEFFAALGGLSGPERDARIVAELAQGNMPDHLRVLQPVRLTGTDAMGQPAEIIICVTPDYLALGSPSDHVRVPMGLPAARQVAARFGMSLPTPKMVDAIWAQADVHLAPAPMPAGPQMSSTDYFLRHNATIEGQLGRQAGLVAGHKKDVVIASRMQGNPGRVAIYGWHRRNGSPIQPVSTVHGATYADYSHGIRLVANTAYVNGRAADLDELLTTARYARILNPDGPLPAPVIRVASR